MWINNEICRIFLWEKLRLYHESYMYLPKHAILVYVTNNFSSDLIIKFPTVLVLTAFKNTLIAKNIIKLLQLISSHIGLTKKEIIYSANIDYSSSLPVFIVLKFLVAICVRYTSIEDLLKDDCETLGINFASRVA